MRRAARWAWPALQNLMLQAAPPVAFNLQEQLSFPYAAKMPTHLAFTVRPITEELYLLPGRLEQATTVASATTASVATGLIASCVLGAPTNAVTIRLHTSPNPKLIPAYTAMFSNLPAAYQGFLARTGMKFPVIFFYTCLQQLAPSAKAEHPMLSALVGGIVTLPPIMPMRFLYTLTSKGMSYPDAMKKLVSADGLRQCVQNTKAFAPFEILRVSVWGSMLNYLMQELEEIAPTDPHRYQKATFIMAKASAIMAFFESLLVYLGDFKDVAGTYAKAHGQDPKEAVRILPRDWLAHCKRCTSLIIRNVVANFGATLPMGLLLVFTAFKAHQSAIASTDESDNTLRY